MGPAGGIVDHTKFKVQRDTRKFLPQQKEESGEARVHHWPQMEARQK